MQNEINEAVKVLEVVDAELVRPPKTTHRANLIERLLSPKVIGWITATGGSFLFIGFAVLVVVDWGL